MQVTAFHKWVYEMCEGDITRIATRLHYEVFVSANQQALNLLNETEGMRYTTYNFEKAAQILIDLVKTPNRKTKQ